MPRSNAWQLRSEDGFITEQLRMQMSGDEGRFSHASDSISIRTVIAAAVDRKL